MFYGEFCVVVIVVNRIIRKLVMVSFFIVLKFSG